MSVWTEIWYCEQFLRAGGTIRPSDWVQFTEEEQASLVVAKERIESERAFGISRAIHDPQGAYTDLQSDDQRMMDAIYAKLDRWAERGIAA
jgi:hypothetical protein